MIDGLSPLERFAWVVEHLPALPGSGIVYTLTEGRRGAPDRGDPGHHGDAYPSRRTRRSTPDREEREAALLANRLKALVATSALGMGYDKPDLGFCVHVGSPPSPVSYYQQVGRAGRGIDRAPVVLLPLGGRRRRVGVLRHRDDPDPDRMRRLLDALRRAASRPPARWRWRRSPASGARGWTGC